MNNDEIAKRRAVLDAMTGGDLANALADGGVVPCTGKAINAYIADVESEGWIPDLCHNAWGGGDAVEGGEVPDGDYLVSDDHGAVFIWAWDGTDDHGYAVARQCSGRELGSGGYAAYLLDFRHICDLPDEEGGGDDDAPSAEQGSLLAA